MQLTYPDFPYIDLYNSAGVREWFSNFKSYLKNAKVVLGQVFVTTGAIIGNNLPPGWTVSRLAPGSYLITHNLNVPILSFSGTGGTGLYPYHVSVSIITDNVKAPQVPLVPVIDLNANTVNIYLFNLAGTAIDPVLGFTFLLTVGL